MARLIEIMYGVNSETSRFLSKIGRSAIIPPIPFTEKQIAAVRYYKQYAGGNIEYIPPGLSLEDLAKLGKVNYSLFAIRNMLFAPATRGGWVLSLYGLVPETIGLERKLCYAHQNELLEKFGFVNGFVDFGQTLEHIYLKLLVLNRTNQYYLGSNFIWTNEFAMRADVSVHLVLAQNKNQGLYAQIFPFTRGVGIGASPLIYPVHPILR